MDLREIPDQPFVRHPWEVSRFRFYFGVLEQNGVAATAGSVLDAGAGDGWFAGEYQKLVAPGVSVSCWDPGYQGPPTLEDGVPHFFRDRPSEKFDLLLLLDVLEHAEDDRQLLCSLVEDNLSPGSFAMISVPAWPFLYGPHDVALSHYRRYRPRELVALGEFAGLEVVCQGGAFHSLMIPRMFSNLASRMRSASDVPELQENMTWTGPRWLGTVVAGALRVDNVLSQLALKAHIKVPGLSTWMLCRKP